MTIPNVPESIDNNVALSRIVAASIIRECGRYLLVQEAETDIYGLWNLAGGHVDRGESIRDAAIREVKEETGFDVELIDKIGIWQEKVEEPVRHCFTAKIIGGKSTPQPGEILDIKWFSYDQIAQLSQSGRLRVAWIFEAITIVEKS